jgi:2-polyprenyl-6-methoxyphenol hydroxylase-like FAD-dependent oxidoreductase
MLIDVLYKHIRQKEKVLTSRPVVDFAMDEYGVSVKCRDGSVHWGSILIGADGIRSTVARQMLRLSGSPKQGKCFFRPPPPKRSPPATLMVLSMPRHVFFVCLQRY